MFDKMHGFKNLVGAGPMATVPKKAKITIDVDLVTQAVAFSTDTPLPLAMLADILCQTASGILKQAMQADAMLVGRGNNVLGANGEAVSAKPKGASLLDATEQKTKG